MFALSCSLSDIFLNAFIPLSLLHNLSFPCIALLDQSPNDLDQESGTLCDNFLDRRGIEL